MSASRKKSKNVRLIKVRANAGKSWDKTDLFFLVAALARGMSPVQVANFLGRDEHEVGEAREFE
jgi:hypothetical protein